MRTRAIAGLAALTLATVGPSAAEAQLFNQGPWSGLYLGGHLGYSWDTGTGSSITGGAAGGHIGLNQQIGVLVLGVEGDYTRSWAQDNNIVPGGGVSANFDNLWSIRGRLGIAVVNNLLLYATGGIGGFDIAINGIATTPFGNINYTGSARHTGFVGGLGGELLLTRSLALRGEGLIYTSNGNGGLLLNRDSDVLVLRAGVSYKF